MSYRIMTESTSDLPQEFCKAHNITVIGMEFVIGGHSYKERSDNDLTPKEFYDGLRQGKQSSTVQVTSFVFQEFVEPFVAAGEDVLHVCFSSGLSGTYASCRQGAEELMEKYPGRKVLVVDSLAASLGEGLLTYYAVMNRDKGMSIEDNARWLEENRLHLCHWFTVDDLMHLHRGGRVSKASAVFGSMLSIKPVLHVDDEGHLILVSKSRGRAASLKALLERMKATVNSDVADQPVFISHGDCLEDAQWLAAEIKKTFALKQDILINNIGAVIGSHSGPGTVALFFMGSKR